MHVRGVEADRVECDQRVDPVDRLGHAGRLEQVELAHALHELDDLNGEPIGRTRCLQPHDLELALNTRKIDPVVQAAALERIVDLARTVAGDDRDRGRLGLDRAELGNRQLVLGQHLEQEGIEGFVGAVEFVDQQHRRTRLCERLQQRALDQHAARVQAVREALAIGFVTQRMGSLGKAYLDHLARDVPLVGRLRDVEAFVALHTQQGRRQGRRQCLRQLGLADARLAFEEQRPRELQAQEQRGREPPVTDVVFRG